MKMFQYDVEETVGCLKYMWKSMGIRYIVLKPELFLFDFEYFMGFGGIQCVFSGTCSYVTYDD